MCRGIIFTEQMFCFDARQNIFCDIFRKNHMLVFLIGKMLLNKFVVTNKPFVMSPYYINKEVPVWQKEFGLINWGAEKAFAPIL